MAQLVEADAIGHVVDPMVRPRKDVGRVYSRSLYDRGWRKAVAREEAGEAVGTLNLPPETFRVCTSHLDLAPFANGIQRGFPGVSWIVFFNPGINKLTVDPGSGCSLASRSEASQELLQWVLVTCDTASDASGQTNEFGGIATLKGRTVSRNKPLFFGIVAPSYGVPELENQLQTFNNIYASVLTAKVRHDEISRPHDSPVTVKSSNVDQDGCNRIPVIDQLKTTVIRVP